MTRSPHDMADLYLAPVVLAVDARIRHLGHLDDDQLAREIAAVSEHPTRDAAERRAALLIAIGAVVELHGWTLSWDDARGVRVAHGPHAVVLGIPQLLRRFVDGRRIEAAAACR
jgi:hypothetical protein